MGILTEKSIVKSAMDDHLDIDITNYWLMDGVMETLEWLRNKGHKLAICSNTNVR